MIHEGRFGGVDLAERYDLEDITAETLKLNGFKFGEVYCFMTKEECVHTAAHARHEGFKVRFFEAHADHAPYKWAFELVDPFVERW